MKTQHLFPLLVLFCICTNAQSQDKSIYIDIAHGQRFWNDPKDSVGTAGADLPRAAYLLEEMTKSAAPFNASVNFIKSEITDKALQKCDLLFLHVPTFHYSSNEVNAIKNYLNQGGSMLIALEVDYWTTLEKTNVNDIIKEFNIQYGTDTADTLAGGYTKKGPITAEPLKITYQFGRSVTGGTPFCFNNQSEADPFGVYKSLEGGGKLIVLGDAMASLYMTEWRGVSDYQCQEFMQAMVSWLLK